MSRKKNIFKIAGVAVAVTGVTTAVAGVASGLDGGKSGPATIETSVRRAAPPAKASLDPYRERVIVLSANTRRKHDLDVFLYTSAVQHFHAQQAAIAQANAAKLARQHSARVHSTYRGRVGGGGVNWDGIANCETGGNWGMNGSRFSGGLGFANSTWNSFGGRQFASNAGSASRAQQIVVAQRVYARYGLSGWGCRRYG
jgi:Transglycosylase-like domain